MARRSIEQRVAEAERILAKRRSKRSQLLTRQKILVGATVLAEATQTPAKARELSILLGEKVFRGPDLAAIAPILEQLRAVISDEAEPIAATPLDNLDDLDSVLRRAPNSPNYNWR